MLTILLLVADLFKMFPVKTFQIIKLKAAEDLLTILTTMLMVAEVDLFNVQYKYIKYVQC